MTCEGDITTCGYALKTSATVEGESIRRIQFRVGQVICD
jgi:hypothetical protein